MDNDRHHAALQINTPILDNNRRSIAKISVHPRVTTRIQRPITMLSLQTRIHSSVSHTIVPSGRTDLPFQLCTRVSDIP
jgi:hypothetical protein